MKTVNSVAESFAFTSDWTWSWPGLWGTIKSFFKCINDSRQCKNNISPLQDEGGCLTNGDMDKAEMFNVFFASVFNTGNGAREYHGCKNDQFPVNLEIVYDLLLQLDS